MMLYCMEEIRIQKYFTYCGIMSRRKTEEEILKGNITVNGEAAKIGQKVIIDRDEVKYKNVLIKFAINKIFTYIMLYKPIGYVTTLSDEKGRKCVTELIKDVNKRVYPVGRLDINSEGLLILTDDGELTNKLTHPKNEIPKIYQVKINKDITDDELKILNQEMIIDGYTIKPVRTEIIDKNRNFTLLKMTLYEGRNRQIRKMCENIGLDIINLKRTAIGTITLGDLRTGQWRYLNSNQIKYLKEGI